MPPDAPSETDLASLRGRSPKEGPVVMLNLLRFHEKAAYADGRESDLAGEEAYGLYGAGVTKLILGLGGRPIYYGRCNTLAAGDGELRWEVAAIIEYPSIDAFIGMVSSEAYRDLHVHREAGLADTVVIQCVSPEQAAALAGSG
ncbi:MAG: DUF1330 domain-containing protein [Myxococcota bacterium]